MLYSEFRQKLESGTPLIGTFVKVAAPELVEQLGFLGFDFVILDMEHGPLSIAQVAELVRAADSAGLPTIVRVAENRHSLIQSALDCGASGVQVPHIESAKELREAVSAARYHPVGSRGVSFSHRAARYGMVDKSGYLAASNRDAVVIAQVETVRGIGALPEILQETGADGFFIGVADLSQSLGYPGQLGHPEVRAAMEAAFASIRQAGRIAGTFVASAEEGLEMVRKGATYVVVASEQSFLAKGAVAELKKWRAALAQT